MTGKKGQFIVTEEQVNKLTTILNKLQMKTKIETSNNQSVFDGLLQVLGKLVDERENGQGEGWKDTKGVKTMKDDMSKIRVEQRKMDDGLDAIKQRNLKANIIINSHANEFKKIDSLILEDDELKKQNKSLLEHISELILEHYEVSIPPEDVSACHRLKKGGVLLRFWNRKNGSAYQQIVSAIKCGGKFGKEKKAARVARTPFTKQPPNFFLCFHLTKKRADIIKTLKDLKKKGKIWSFASNQNGVISMKKTETSGKMILTRDWDDGPECKTYTPDEIYKLVSK